MKRFLPGFEVCDQGFNPRKSLRIADTCSYRPVSRDLVVTFFTLLAHLQRGFFTVSKRCGRAYVSSVKAIF